MVVNRKSNYELCRIVAMLMIVSHHFAIRNGFQIETVGFLSIWLRFLESAGKIGVNLFILLTGYFMVGKQNKLEKIISISLTTMLYSTVFLGIWLGYQYVSGGGIHDIRQIRNALFPICSSEYWFITNYVLLYLTIPILNKLLEVYSRKQCLVGILAGFFVLSIIPSVLQVELGFSYYIWFVFMYCLGAYWRLYIRTNRTWQHYMLISVCLYATLIAIETLLDGLFPGRIDMLQLYAMNQILIVIISVMLFAMFSCVQLRYIPQINEISKHTIGVYLVHDNQLIGAFLVWGVIRKLFHVTELYEKGSIAFIPISIIIVFLVFGGGISSIGYGRGLLES